MTALRIEIVTDSNGWMIPYTEQLRVALAERGHEASVVHAAGRAPVDFRYILSFSRLIPAEVLAASRSNVVVHGSALPEGRGWSPWSWQIVEGRSELTLSLFEAAESVDSGPIYLARTVALSGGELVDEWRRLQAEATLDLCLQFADKFPGILNEGRAQVGDGSHYGRRRPEDSRLDPALSLGEQFDLLRVVDNDRYPAFFDFRGRRYKLAITEWNSE